MSIFCDSLQQNTSQPVATWGFGRPSDVPKYYSPAGTKKYTSWLFLPQWHNFC